MRYKLTPWALGFVFFFVFFCQCQDLRTHHYGLNGVLLTVWTMKSTVPSRRVTLLKRNSRYLATGGKRKEVDKRKRSASRGGETLNILKSWIFDLILCGNMALDRVWKRKNIWFLYCTLYRIYFYTIIKICSSKITAIALKPSHMIVPSHHNAFWNVNEGSQSSFLRASVPFPPWKRSSLQALHSPHHFTWSWGPITT